MKTQYFIKIVLYKPTNRVLAEEVIYYRARLPLDLVDKYRWYFDYLAARVKVCHPRRLIKICIGPQDLPTPEEYRENKIKNLLKHKKGRLKKLESTIVQNDLFGISEKEHIRKKDKYKSEIEKLEQGEFNGYVPVKYINKIKRWIN